LSNAEVQVYQPMNIEKCTQTVYIKESLCRCPRRVYTRRRVACIYLRYTLGNNVKTTTMG
jgi:hypothetical protein